ncbi:MAG: protein tyrosine phosphatase family protein [Pseudomonadales bacterium]|nr:protein tyrosine phosphatase family protein [Pseudomonadales bacterium]
MVFPASVQKLIRALVVLGAALALPAGAAVEEIVGFKRYSETFASAGQPTAEQLPTIKAAGFERIIYLAFSDNPGALPDEDRLAFAQGLGFAHLAVDFANPTVADFRAFAGLMAAQPAAPTFVHCQVNYRASAFSALYRIIHLEVPAEAAFAAMGTVWDPQDHPQWIDFIRAVLADAGRLDACGPCERAAQEP